MAQPDSTTDVKDSKTDVKTDSVTEVPTPRPKRSPEEVQAALEEARHSLVAHIDAIKHELSPAELAKRPINHVKRIFVTADGKPKTRTLAIIGVSIAVYVVYRLRK